jgi:transcriptional/translational regulatory protein YebC/TACO1
LEPEEAIITWQPQEVLETSEEVAEKVMRLIEALEDLDDVQNVISNIGL